MTSEIELHTVVMTGAPPPFVVISVAMSRLHSFLSKSGMSPGRQVMHSKVMSSHSEHPLVTQSHLTHCHSLSDQANPVSQLGQKNSSSSDYGFSFVVYNVAVTFGGQFVKGEKHERPPFYTRL